MHTGKISPNVILRKMLKRYLQGNRDIYKKEARKQEKGKYQYKNRKQ
jgi:hypothetical protein